MIFKPYLNKTKRLLELLFYFPLDTITLLGRQRTHNLNTVAIVHVELLGDYILWLPYGQLLAGYFKEKNRRIVLVVNDQVLPLVKRQFPECMAIGVSRTKFLKNIGYRIELLRFLATQNPGKTYHDTYPRDALIGDAIVRALGAPAVGFKAVFADRSTFDKSLHRRLYSYLVPEQKNTHQSLRHLSFAKTVGAPMDKLAPATQLADDSPSPTTDTYIVIAPGGSQQFRRWPAQHFASLARQILERHHDLKIVVLGTQSEFALGEQIVSELGPSACNMAGKTDTEALINWIQHARLLLGNDSGAGHIAVACGTPSLIVVGGGHYGRCFPYEPSEARVRKIPVTVTHKMDCFGCDWVCRYPVSPGVPVPCIAGISVEAAWDEVKKLLASCDEST